jgi:hypothetical protein
MNQSEKQQAADEKVASRMVTLMGGQRNDAEFLIGELKYKLGIEWVDYAFPLMWKDPLLSSPLFWSWWKDKWAAADTILSARLKARMGVLHHSVEGGLNGGSTAFYHSPEEFIQAYELYHIMVMEETQMEAAVLAAIKKTLGITYDIKPNAKDSTGGTGRTTSHGSARMGGQSEGLENIPV